MKLKDDTDWRVARLIVKNPNITEEALQKLKTDNNFRMRYLACVSLLKMNK